jgi:predicted RNA-binding protein with PUA-like domain
MQIGDRILFYHSSCETPGIAGIAEVVSSPHADMTQYDPQSKYYDPKATIENPRWYCVDVGYIAHLDRVLTIRELRDIPWLESMKILEKWNRLSITPVTDEEYAIIYAYTHS